jgi:hypothetical protein
MNTIEITKEEAEKLISLLEESHWITIGKVKQIEFQKRSLCKFDNSKEIATLEAEIIILQDWVVKSTLLINQLHKITNTKMILP